MGKVVTAAVVVIKDGDGLQRYFYQGSTLPDDLPKGEVERLIEAEMVGDEKELQAKPDGEATTQQREAKPTRQNTSKNG